MREREREKKSNFIRRCEKNSLSASEEQKEKVNFVKGGNLFFTCGATWLYVRSYHVVILRHFNIDMSVKVISSAECQMLV